MYMFLRCVRMHTFIFSVYSLLLWGFYCDLLSACCSDLYFVSFAIYFIVYAYNDSLNFTETAQNIMYNKFYG